MIRHQQREAARRVVLIEAAAENRLKETESRVKAEFAGQEVILNPPFVGGTNDIRALVSHYAPGVSRTVPESSAEVILHPLEPVNGAIQDDAIRINEAIENASRPAVIHLAEGRYEIRSPVGLRSGIVLRGEGMRRTVVISTQPAGQIHIIGQADPEAAAILSGGECGTRRMVLDHTDGFARGDMVRVFSATDTGSNPAFRGQIAAIAAVVAPNTLRLDRPLRLTCPPPVRIQRMLPIRFAGVESMTIHTREPDTENPVAYPAADRHTIKVDKAVDCWVRDCELSFSRTSHVWITDSRFVTVEGCYMHHGWRYDSPHGYGICLADFTSDCLVADNVFAALRHAMIVKAGANGNVFAYNFSTENNPQNNKDDSCDFSAHGFYAHANLLEGNVLQFAQSSDNFGPSGPLMTFFRNRIEGMGILITNQSHFPVIAGNVFDRGGVYMERGIVGSLAVGNVKSETPLRDTFVYNEFKVFRHDEPRRAPALIPSLFLKHKPDFLADTPWPCFGPDVSPDTVLPAQQRYTDTYQHWTAPMQEQRQPQINTDDGRRR